MKIIIDILYNLSIYLQDYLQGWFWVLNDILKSQIFMIALRIQELYVLIIKVSFKFTKMNYLKKNIIEVWWLFKHDCTFYFPNSVKAPMRGLISLLISLVVLLWKTEKPRETLCTNCPRWWPSWDCWLTRWLARNFYNDKCSHCYSIVPGIRVNLWICIFLNKSIEIRKENQTNNQTQFCSWWTWKWEACVVCSKVLVCYGWGCKL